MELCSWGDLAKQIKSRVELPEEQKYFSEDDILKAIGQTCQALKFADDCGIIHCDIKPGNILVASGGILKIADFGLSKILTSKEGEIINEGTLLYMSPEQVLRQPVTHKSDIWSLGVTIHEACTL